MKKIIKIVVLVAVLAAAAAVSYWAWLNYYPVAEEEIHATGTIEATNVNLNAKLAGTIKFLNAEAGATVKKDQLIAELSRNDLLAQRERDQLSVVKAEAGLADLRSGARTQEINEAKANVNIAKANLEKTTADLTRLETLFQNEAVSQVECEKARTAKEISQNQLLAAESRLNLLLSGSRSEVINAARVEVERNQAIVKATDILLEDLKVISPLEGVVIAKNYQEGEYVQAGQTLATIVNLNDLWIKVFIPTDDLPNIILGQEVAFTVSGLAQSFTGVVEEIAARGEFTPKTIQTKKERTNIVFAVKIRISSEGGILKPGMPADVVFPRRQEG